MSEQNPRRVFLDYETYASRWWLGWIGNQWLQKWAGRYFAWKVNRKYAAYRNGLAIQQRLEQIDRFRKLRDV